jgi:hypothetical protein
MHTTIVARIFMDPLNTKVVGRDGPSHASARLATDRLVALSRLLSIEEILPWNHASRRLNRTCGAAGSLSEFRCASSLARFPGRARSYMSSAYCYANADVSRLSLFWSGNRDRAGMATVQEHRYIALRLLIVKKDG